jgi:hypothetical protein
MKPITIIECAAEDGLTLTVSPDRNIKVSEDQNKIDKWIKTIRENKGATVQIAVAGKRLMQSAKALRSPDKLTSVAAELS